MPAEPPKPPLTVGQLARRCGLSRTTLLYYDRLGLLKPSARSQSSYRLYAAKDVERLEQICTFRRAGLSLAAIRRVLQPRSQSALVHTLEQRLHELNTEIEKLRDQQRLIVGILQNGAYQRFIGVMNKERWKSLLRASGFSDEDMSRWHAGFERIAPDQHQEFLKFLCIPDEEITAIRQRSRTPPTSPLPQPPPPKA